MASVHTLNQSIHQSANQKNWQSITNQSVNCWWMNELKTFKLKYKKINQAQNWEMKKRLNLYMYGKSRGPFNNWTQLSITHTHTHTFPPPPNHIHTHTDCVLTQCGWCEGRSPGLGAPGWRWNRPVLCASETHQRQLLLIINTTAQTHNKDKDHSHQPFYLLHTDTLKTTVTVSFFTVQIFKTQQRWLSLSILLTCTFTQQRQMFLTI